jgi:diguanylate cyclase (GGDEF)-like protein
VNLGSGGLNELVVAAGALLDPAALARLATDHTRNLLGCDGALLSWWDEPQGVLVPLAYVDPRKSGPDPVFHPGQGLVGATFRNETARVVHDYRAEVEHPMVWTTIQSAVAVPLASDHGVCGVLAAIHHDGDAFRDEDVAVLETVAAQVAPTLSTMKLLAAAQRRTAEAEALAALMRAAASAPDHDEVIHLVSEYATRLLGADLAGVVLREPTDGATAWRGVYGNETDSWRGRLYHEGHGARPAIFGGKTTLVVAGDDEPTIDPERYPFFSAERVQTGLALPLLCDNEPMGSLVLGWRFRVRPAAAHVELAEALAGFASTLIDQATTQIQRDALIANAPVALAAMDADGIVTVCEGAAAEAIGLGQNVVGRRYTEVIADSPALIALIQTATSDSTTSLSVQVREHSFDIVFHPRGSGGYLVATDVTDRARLERELAHQATHDELTGLANRTLVVSSAEKALTEGPLAVAVADIRAFDAVNETIGHDAGDVLLRVVGQRLAATFHSAVVVGRTGGDEFTVVAHREEIAGARALAQAVRDNIEAAVDIDGRPMHVEARCGVAYSENGEDARSLLRRADSALQSARRGVGMLLVHDTEMAATRREQLELTADLRSALHDGRLDVAFQPIVELSTGKIVRAEALARWRHPRLGSIPPDRFVDLAERSGLVHLLTAHMIDIALDRCARALGIPVSVNLSGLDLVRESLPSEIEQALRRHDVSPNMLSIEITESHRFEEDPEALEILDRVREVGVTVAIDDFGTGWSSYTLLERLPAQQLKLDRTYVKRMVTDATSRAIVQSAVTLGQALGLQIVAEGIEDEATNAALHGLGCEIGQGFLFAKPMSATDLASYNGASD